MPDFDGAIEKLAPGDPVGLADLLRIYQSSIEPSEQKSASEIAEIVSHPRYQVLVLRVAGDIRGFSISFVPAAGFWLLEYLAVDDRLRSRGLGRTLFLAAKLLAEKRAAEDGNKNAPCVLEVDRPHPASAPGNDVARRLLFYRGLGCRRVEGLAYILPLTANGPPPPMTLLVHGLDGRDTLPKALVAGWLQTIYRDVYAQSADDFRIVTMLSSLPESISLTSI